ncbi:holin [Fredinandcohnia humi]
MFEAGIIVAVIIGLNEIAKGFINARYIPLFSLLVGVIAGVLFLPVESLKEGILYGVIVGLSANGLFDLTKVSKEKLTIKK